MFRKRCCLLVRLVMVTVAVATVFLLVSVAVARDRDTEERNAQDNSRDLRNGALEQDWLFQAGERPEREAALEEITRARHIVERIQGSNRAPDLTGEIGQLAGLEKTLHAQSRVAGRGVRGRELYLAVRRAKRRIMLKSPEIDFSGVLFIDQPYPRFPEGRPWPYDRRGGQICRHENSHRNGMMAVPGGKLVVLEGLAPWGTQRQLGPQVPGSFWRPDLSFDAGKVLFCFKPYDEKAFHLYEVDIDGRNLRQLTFGRYDDMDPIYLPDGHIMFVTTRGHTYVRCVPHGNSYVLARCDGDGKNIYVVSRSNECDWLPALLDDGRVIYSRWEYTDKPLWRIQSLWTTNPDGTNTSVFWGNQSVWPDHLAEPRPIPGTHRVMFAGLGHHDWFAGSIGIVDPCVGREFPDGLTKVTANVPWPEVGNGPVDPVECTEYVPPGAYEAFKTPFPLSEDLFLVSARRGQGDDKFRLYAMDIWGNCELIYEGNHNVWHAIPVRARVSPPVQPDRVTWPGTGKERRPIEPGVLYSADVYEGVPDLPRGTVKYLRVFQQDHTTFSTGAQTFRWSGPGTSIVQEDGVKRVLGTVPVHEDGSVYCEVPAGKMLYFQLLDKHYRALQTMRSFTGVMPGERRGCVGCHEMHSGAPPNRAALALRRPPARLKPPPWGDESIGYERFVQPVLDRYCGECHQGDGEARKQYDLTLRSGYGFMKEPYLTLVGSAAWKSGSRGTANMKLPDPAAPGTGLAGILKIESYDAESIVKPFRWYNSPEVRLDALVEKYTTIPPMTALSYKSPLIELAMSGDHYDVKVDPIGLRRLIAWVDAMGPYRGGEEIRALPDPDFEGIDELAIRPRTKTAPKISRP